eukprot:scaffold218825_cov18-Tisochrysis_lutea.AAC.1
MLDPSISGAVLAKASTAGCAWEDTAEGTAGEGTTGEGTAGQGTAGCIEDAGPVAAAVAGAVAGA